MAHYKSNIKKVIWNYIIIFFSIIGLIAFTTILFPQVRQMILDWSIQILHKEPFSHEMWLKLFLSLASGGICFILFIDYCTLTSSGKAFVQEVKQGIKNRLSEIDYNVFIKPVLFMFGIYLLGILTIIRANFSYMDDLRRSIEGCRVWYDWNRYVPEFLSIFVHADTNLTDISPLPQLLAILILSISSILLIYIIGNGKITILSVIASIPLGLSPFYIECLSYKFDAPYMALSILVSIIPFLFISHKKAFFFCSVISLLIMCITYQAASGLYIMIVLFLCFKNWNSRKETNKKILSFIGISAAAFCLSMLLFKFFIMKSVESEGFYTSTKIHSLTQLIPGILNNIKSYAMAINYDLGVIWKIGIAIVCVFFTAKSVYTSSRKKILSLLLSILYIGLSFITSYGIYLLLNKPLFYARAMPGFGVFLAILCIYIVSDYNKLAIITVIALNWCFFVFSFSYGNALADQARYAEFRIGLLLHDLSGLCINHHNEEISIKIKNSIDFAPTVKNIAKQYPVIEKLVPKRLGVTDNVIQRYYILDHFNFNQTKFDFITLIDFDSMNLPVVLDTYYHTVQSDGENIIVTIKH